MNKNTKIIYCTANEKYDLFIGNEYCGKFYTMQEVIRRLRREFPDE